MKEIDHQIQFLEKTIQSKQEEIYNYRCRLAELIDEKDPLDRDAALRHIQRDLNWLVEGKADNAWKQSWSDRIIRTIKNYL